MVIQTIIPVFLFGKVFSRIEISGGTHVPWSPSFHYLDTIFLPILRKMGAEVSIDIDKWGWYPKGGGNVKALIKNVHALKAINLINRGKLLDLSVLSAVSNLPLHIAERQRDQTLKQIKHLEINPRISIKDAPSVGQGTFLFLAAQFEGSRAGVTSLGRKGKRAEEVADGVCNEFLKFLDSKGTIDIHLADQIVLYMALAVGSSTFITECLSKHLLTNIWVIEQFLPVSFDVNQETGKVGVEGIGFK